MIGKPVGVLGIADSPPAIVKDVLGNLLIEYWKPEKVHTTHDIASSLEQYIEAAKDFVSTRGVETILLACTGLSTARIAPILEDKLGAIVIDPVIISGIVAYYAAKGNAPKEMEFK
jgi:allantoin racemase